MAKNTKSVAFYEAGSWYHRVKILKAIDKTYSLCYNLRKDGDEERTEGILTESRVG